MMVEILKRKLFVSKAYIDDICLGLLHSEPKKGSKQAEIVLKELQMKFGFGCI